MRRIGTLLLVLLITAATLSPALGAEEEQISPISGISEGLVTAVTTLVVFAVLLVVLGKFAWGPIAQGLRAREESIRRDLADAEAARKKAEDTLREYSARLAAAEEQVGQMLQKAASDARKIADSIRIRAQEEGEEIKERASRDIEAAKVQAIAEIYQKAADLATDVASKILRRSLNPEDQRDLVNQSIEQMQSVAEANNQGQT